MSKFFTNKISRCKPYIAGIQPKEEGWIKLNTNENPYPPSPEVSEALRNFERSNLRLYPPGDGGGLRKAIAEAEGLKESYIFCGNGSDEVLALAFQTFFAEKTPVYSPDISYGFYPVWGSTYEAGLVYLPLNEDFTVNPNEYVGGMGVVLANPNAPTGLAVGLDVIEQLLQQNPNGVVLIDEAYINFAEVESAAKLVEKYENLLVVRTFSKSHSLAGLRVGYAIGQPHLIDGLFIAKESFNSYPIDILAQAIATVSLKETKYLKSTCEKVIKTRTNVKNQLEEMGYRVLPPQGNFIFTEVKDKRGAEALYEYLLKNKILTRYWNKPRISEFLRVTIGTDEEMEKFISCVNQW